MSEQNQETEEKATNAWNESVDYEYNGENMNLSLLDVAHTICSGGKLPSLKEAKNFMSLCKTQQLNPYMNEAYLIKYSDDAPAQLVVGKDVFEKRADSFPSYNGKECGVIVLRGEEEIDLEGAYMRETDKLQGAWCRVYRKDRKYPASIRVTLAEYIGKNGFGKVNKQWSSKPLTMIRKVAVAQCLREAFPKNFEGMFMQEEMDSSKNPTNKEAATNISKETKSPLEKMFDTSEAVDGELVNENSVDPNESEDVNLNEEISEVLQEDDRVEPVVDGAEGSTFEQAMNDFHHTDDHEDGRMGDSN
jgi:phage recombination protein Bet